MKTLFLPLLLLAHSVIPAQEWALSLSSNVELRTWKLSTRADKEEKGLAGASIKLYKGGGLVNEVSSSGNGDFRINIPANGEYLLEVSYPGCNSKKFAINTKDVPENVAKDNFKPSYRIDGFIMAKALPGIDYSYLSQPLVKVVYASRGQKFLDDDNTTEKSIKAVTKIADAENKLIEKFCSTNREGDEALNKPDCPLAKSLYEKALTLIPGEAYPAQQLAKVGKCLQDKEAADKKALEASAAKPEPPQTGKKDADKKAVEDAVAKARADKAAKEQAMNDQLAKAKAEESKKKEKEKDKGEKLASDKQEPAKPAATSASQPTTAVKTKPGTIKIKEKSEEQLEAERKRAGLAKSQAEDAAAIKADAEKAEQKRRDREKKEKEELAKDKEEQQKKMEERRAREKEEAEKEAAEQKEKAEEARKKRAEAEARDKEEAQKEEAERKERAEKAAQAKAEQEAKDKEEAAKKAAEKKEKAEKAAQAQAEQEAKDKEEAKKEAAERAEQEKADNEEREKREAERAAKEKEERRKTYEKIEEKYASGKANADYSIPPVLGSTDMYKEKIKKGDDHFNNKRYKEAKTEYEAALKVKPADEYATNKLNEVNKLITP